MFCDTALSLYPVFEKHCISLDIYWFQMLWCE